jgi:hypothetical protein
MIQRRPLGTAEPDVVPAGVTMDVTFGVPPGQEWVIFVNPEVVENGGLVGARDVPEGASGRMPFTFHIDEDGQVSALGGLIGPGWFGN